MTKKTRQWTVQLMVCLWLWCGMCDCAVSNVKNPLYEEFFMEHQVSEKDARKVFLEMKAKLLNATPPTWCPKCTSKDKKYCLGQFLINDHCCCDQHHDVDELPWVPHTCYVGHNACKSHKGSCLLYTEAKECCCNRFLAEQLAEFYIDSSTSSLLNHQRLNIRNAVVITLVPLCVFNLFFKSSYL